MLAAKAGSALLAMGDGSLTQKLRGLLLAKDKHAALTAAAGLARAGDASGLELAKRVLSSYGSVWELQLATDTVVGVGDQEAALAALQTAAGKTALGVWVLHLIDEKPNAHYLKVLDILRQSPSAVVRTGVAITLGKTGLNDAIPMLVDMLSDRDSVIPGIVAKSLTKLTGHEWGKLRGAALISSWTTWWESNRDRFPAGGRCWETGGWLSENQ